MKRTKYDDIKLSGPRNCRGGRPIDPNGDLAEARALGMNYWTWRSRKRQVREGRMTLEEAKTLPIRSKQEVARMGAAAKRKGKKT